MLPDGNEDQPRRTTELNVACVPQDTNLMARST